ncbi:ribbon-helix-helix protein, CopG family [Bradyrhizobium sp. sBnM-33]|uniref:ribbon-helix-helix protein, CopG family n=1 Tax=Bradyrhizobium sp. sBnM-33 TaxID=2831780 RepID=UPI001BCBC3F1|nr:ribbon-helix-helix protein, CopG family [Bradyrhizobium sp. sBnM-33]WOH48875.1 ribbon-helix-helix protein, CopG family [Bradyrhizobium sp. sBnM-33]
MNEPTGKKLTIIGVRASDDWVAALDRWIADRGPSLSRPEAIRRLVELGLQATPKPS